MEEWKQNRRCDGRRLGIGRPTAIMFAKEGEGRLRQPKQNDGTRR